VTELLTSQSVLDAANGVLDFSGNLVGLALAFQLAIASNLSGNFFDFAFSLFSGSFNAILVHLETPLVMVVN